LVKTAWSALRADKELLGIPIVGGLVSVLAVVPLLAVALLASDSDSVPPSVVIVGIIEAFVVAIIATFFAVVLAAGSHLRMNRGNPTLMSAMAVAW